VLQVVVELPRPLLQRPHDEGESRAQGGVVLPAEPQQFCHPGLHLDWQPGPEPLQGHLLRQLQKPEALLAGFFACGPSPWQGLTEFLLTQGDISLTGWGYQTYQAVMYAQRL